MGAHYANMLGLLILPFIRPMIPGPTPLFFIESSTPGSGKATPGQHRQDYRHGSAAAGACAFRQKRKREVRKMITAELIGARPIIVFDNFLKPVAD